MRTSEIPASGLKGLRDNWHNDLIAAINVSLVALPLSLGIAVASGVEPIAGVFSAIIAGVITTFFRGSHVAINGPAPGMIAVILGGLQILEGNIHYVLAAIVVAGVLQVLLGLLKLGRFAKMFPSSVLNGILAAIGVIIFAKQIHFALGTSSDADNIIGTLQDAIYKLPEANPYIVMISLTSLLVLIFYKKVPFRWFQLLPRPMWVLLLSLPYVFIFDFFTPHKEEFLGRSYPVGPEFLIRIPDNLMDSIMHPDFAMIGSGGFWFSVIAITLIGSVETLAGARAIDKLDPFKRVTDLDKEMVGVGLSTMVAGALGALPVITVIVQSTVNLHSNARTRWSNFFHGILLILFVIILSPVLQSVPLAALAAILVHTGYKLASPQVFYQAYDQGVEQLLFVTSTLVITLYTDILVGILGGIMITLVLHILLAKVGLTRFFKMTFRAGSKILKRDDGSYDVRIKGIANFLAVMNINHLLEQLPNGVTARIDLSKTRLVDLSVMENLIEFKRIQDNHGGNVTIQGLDQHWSSSSHNRALKLIVSQRPRRITRRQMQLQKMAIENGWSFEHEVDWNTSYLQNFRFFDSRPLKGKSNVIRGKVEKYNAEWEIADIIFDEGAMLSLEVFHTTVLIIRLGQEIPLFSVEKEGPFDKIFDRVKAFSGYTEHGFKHYPDISRKLVVMGEDETAVKKLFTKKLNRFIKDHDVQHIESNGEALMIFKYLHIAPADEAQNMIDFSEQLLDHLNLETNLSE